MPLLPPTSAAPLPALHFDPWLTVLGTSLLSASAEILAALPAPEITPGRKPRVDAVERRRVCICSLVANLVALICTSELHDALAVPLRVERRTRYNCPRYHTAVLSDVLKGLQDAGMVSVIPAAARRTRTYLTPTSRFENLLEGHRVTLEDVGRVAGGETILLRCKDPQDGSTTLLEYPDSSETCAMRREMEVINRTINSADIRFGGKPVAPTHLVRMFQRDFRHHGRMYRGFWQSLPKGKRRLLSINGEAVTDLDFRTMFLQLAYLRQGVEMQCGDPYAILGLEECRGTVKKLISSLFARSGGAMRLPPGLKQQLPEGWTMKRFEQCV